MELLPPAAYTLREMRALLTEGAKYDGGTHYQAAIHLVAFTQLPGTEMLARHVTVEDRWSMTYQANMRVALISDWAGLLREKYLEGSERQMVVLAASFAAGRKIDLGSALTSGLGWAHVGCIAEAMFIRCAMDKFLVVSGTGELLQHQAMQRELSGGTS